MLGLLTVVATAVGCLFMMNTNMSFVASKSGLVAVGVLLLLLNMGFVLIMVILITRAGVDDFKNGLLWVYKHFKACWACFGSPAGGSSRGVKTQVPLSMQMQSQSTSCSTSRASSTTGLMQPVSSDSGDLYSLEQL